ncbi:RNA 2'-phosphotransferase [Amycolatopsis sp. FDAARGOS 1241]|uniref:RNA 2'-phosphotransferase n=1 Tax=Amycolatopsis sp. FDAARGOS 1241 TaxID=2778070 RepID=UPI00194EE09B|nr:RNA 2'-phosphotransferase [Amycolatopsis sp. FDAARGOS 1241]QRP44173.1 RNA 2'-phosphotransferase [Amycolatopsis sp. FDAARGOS 1241]
MNEKHLTRVSKRLSRHLRHDPGSLGLVLDPAGWVSVDVLLAALREHGFGVTRAQLDEVVARNNKQRFSFDETGTRIRANQGHSVEVELGLAVVAPPAMLYHGTASTTVPVIFTEGLRPMRRHAVHLSADVETALKVGARHGRPVVLRVAAGEMALAGHEFQRSDNGVWLTAEVPPPYLTLDG